MSYVVERCAIATRETAKTSTPSVATRSRRAIERFVARDATDGVVVGACAFWMRDDGATGFVSGLEVERAHRRRGVATTLVRAVERECARRGATRCALSVNKGNRGATKTYERLGYVRDEETRGAMAWVRDPLVLVQHRMSKPIGIEGERGEEESGAGRSGAEESAAARARTDGLD